MAKPARRSEALAPQASQAQAAGAPPPAQAPPRRRLLGLGARVGAAAVFIPCFAVIAWRGDIYFVILVNVIAVAGTLEFRKMLEAKGLQPQRATGLVAAVALPWLEYLHAGAYVDFGLTVLVLAILTLELGRNRGESIAHAGGAVLGTTYVAWLASHLVALRELPLHTGGTYALGFHAVAFAFVTTWMADTGAYLVGSLIGRHKLAPRISPGKSVEGALGGVAFATLAGAWFAHAVMQQELAPAAGAALGAMAALVGLVGDLAESMMKRDAHVKDTSDAIPGHGGALDRFDSVLFSVPLLYYVLRFFVL